MGGENDSNESFTPLIAGSSPRGRGKLCWASGEVSSTGLIPAWAGKTQSRESCAAGATAHPRVGGENTGKVMNGVTQRGSSPRGRGKHGGGRGLSRAVGLIPA